jgi:DNA helicase-2/ATP-dependent DNA helicase PcrA
VCTTILEHHESGKALKDQVVLFRTSHHSDLLEVELGRRGVPFVKYGGLRFLEASHIRDLLAGLRLVENPRDELAWLRVLQLADGIGPKSASRMMEELGVRDIGFADPNPLDRFCSDPTLNCPNHRHGNWHCGGRR